MNQRLDAFSDHTFARNYIATRRPPTDCLRLYQRVLAEESGRLKNTKKVPSYFDIGAGVGVFSETIQNAAGCSAQLIAFEPADPMRRILQENVAGSNWVILDHSLPLPSPMMNDGLAWVSDLLHLFPSNISFLEALKRSLPNLDTVVLRTHTTETVGLCEWQNFFPKAFADDAAHHQSLEELVDAFYSHGYQLRSKTAVDESFTLSSENYIQYFDNRSISRLAVIPDDDFAQGMSNLRAHARNTSLLTRTIWRNLLVFDANK